MLIFLFRKFINQITHGSNLGAYTSDVSTGVDMGFMLVFGVLFSSLTGALSGANNSGEQTYVQLILLEK